MIRNRTMWTSPIGAVWFLTVAVVALFLLLAVGLRPVQAQDSGELVIDSNLPTVDNCASSLRYVVNYRQRGLRVKQGTRKFITGTAWPSSITVSGVKPGTQYKVWTTARCRTNNGNATERRHSHGWMVSTGKAITVSFDGSNIEVSWPTRDYCAQGYQVYHRLRTADSGTTVDIASSTTGSYTISAPASGRHIIRVKCIARHRDGKKVGPSIGRDTVVVP